MAKTRFEALALKDREWILRWTTLHTEIQCDLAQVIQEHRDEYRASVARLANRPPTGKYVYNSAGDLFASSMFFLGSAILQRAIARRLKDNDTREIRDDLFLSVRVGYLSNLLKTPAYSGGYDCLHVLDILRAYAVVDRELVVAYVARYPGPSAGGHPFTKLLCNAVTAVLQRSGDLSSFPDKLRKRKERGYDQAMLHCIAAVIEGNRSEVMESFQVMFRWYRKKTISEGMLQFFPMQLHGLFNFACDALRTLHDQPALDAPTHPPWDAEFQSLTSVAPNPDQLAVLSHFSPALVQWAQQLPPQVAQEEFARLADEPKEQARSAVPLPKW